jgi:hypothetical protein
MQNLTDIQTKFDTALQTAVAAATVSGITQIIIYPENKTMNFDKLPDITTKLGVRLTLIPAKTIVETIGPNGFVSVNGNYAIDVCGQVNTSYVAVQTLSDTLLSAFSRGTKLTLTSGDVVTVMNASPSVNTNQGGWTMGKLYARQIIIEFQCFTQP